MKHLWAVQPQNRELLPSFRQAAMLRLRAWRASLQDGLPVGALRLGGRFALRTIPGVAIALP